MTRYLVDNSVLQHLPRSTAVRDAVAVLLEAQHELCSCALSVDEFGFSVRSAAEHADAVRRLRTTFLYLPLTPTVDDLVVEIRAALWSAGRGRAAGVVDVAIAAVAVNANVTVLHYDGDFEHISDVYPRLNTAGVVPRGTVD